MNIGNRNGRGDLEYSIVIEGNSFTHDWLKIMGNAEGRIEPGLSEVSDLQIDTYDLIPGEYTSTITILSNDPYTPVKHIPFILQVIEDQIPMISYEPQNKNNRLTDRITLYPNPASDYLNIDLTSLNTKELSFTIINTCGEVVRTLSEIQDVNIRVIQYSISDLKPGIYFLRIVSPFSEISPVRFVKE